MYKTNSLNDPLLKEFSFDYADISINDSQIIKILGYNNDSVPEPIIESITEIIKLFKEKIKPKSGYKIFNPEKIKFNDCQILIEDKIFNCGKMIYSCLSESESLTIMVATIGNEIEFISKEFMKSNDLLKGFITDKVASVIVENLADLTENILREELRKFEYKITNRYSPGYCGWNVDDQQQLFALLPPKFCGIELNNHSMMMPIKSISSIIGAGKKVERKGYQCLECDLEFCFKRDNNE